MTIGKLGEVTLEEFSVLDSSNLPVSGIPLTEFNAYLFDPSNNEIDSTNVIFIELGHGHYRAVFIPNQVGNWLLAVYHSVYFPWGKTNTIQVFSNDFDSINIMLQKILGLVQENFLMDNTIYDDNGNMISARIRTYSNSNSVGTDNDILETYNISTTYTDNQLTSYQVTT